MSEIAGQNIGILQQRWPALAERVLSQAPPEATHWEGDEQHPALSVNGLRLWSAYDTAAEARIQATMIPDHSAEAWVYGIGGGDLIRELRQREQLKRLYVVPLNLGLFHLLLHILDHRDWLSDPRVQLRDPAALHSVHQPFAAIPPCLSLCDESLNRLRDKLTDALIRPFEAERQAQRAPMRKRHIAANSDFIAADGDVADLFGSAPGSTAFVAAAGPTLSKTAPWILEHRQQGLLIAVDGALSPLLKLGLAPDYVLSLDDNPQTIIRYFQGDLSACKATTLVYTPIVDHRVMQLWPGPRLTMYTHESIYDELRESNPKASLFVAGSVIHPAVDLAVKLGSRKVLLFGADFGFPGDRIHANDEAPIAFYENAAQAGTTTTDGNGNTIRTLASFNGYRLDMEEYISRHPDIAFFNTSRDGACIHGAPFLDGMNP